jgi:hypothetical protein
VTIARVASRLSTNRVYQPLLLQGLKDFFDGKKRLVKQGDLLAVKVDLNQLQYLQASSSGDGAETALWASESGWFLISESSGHVSRTTQQGIDLPIDCRQGHLLHSYQHRMRSPIHEQSSQPLRRSFWFISW